MPDAVRAFPVDPRDEPEGIEEGISRHALKNSPRTRIPNFPR